MQDAKDPDFIPKIGEHADWIFITHDARQRYVPDEQDAIMGSGVAQFIHTGHMRHDDMAASFVLAANKMMTFRDKHTPPFIAKLYRPERKSNYLVVAGAIRLVLTSDQWRENQQK